MSISLLIGNDGKFLLVLFKQLERCCLKDKNALYSLQLGHGLLF